MKRNVNLTARALAPFLVGFTLLSSAMPTKAQGCAAPSFGPVQNFTAGSLPIAVAVGDFNLDGKSDLATANEQSNTASVLLGNGSGSFGAPTNFAVGSFPTSIAVGDFNSDGKTDLVVGNFFSNSVSVLLGNGAGGFGPAVNLPVASFPTSVAVADFNLDGKPDLATSNFNNGHNVSVLLGNGAGGFGAAVNFGGGESSTSIAVNDFNLDGRPDLAVADASLGQVLVMLGNGSGGFGAAIGRSVGAAPRSVAAGDFNLDGLPDLAVANGNSNDVAVLLGDGGGLFGAVHIFPVGNFPLSVMVADYDLDGKPDLVTANALSNNVSLLLGNGSGSFGSSINLAVGTFPTRTAVGDFNLDGKPDLAVGKEMGDSVAVLLNDCTADSTPPNVVAPSDITVYTGAGSVSCSVNVSDGALGTVTASDDSGNVSVSRSGVPAANQFPVGITTITYTATDNAGNTAAATQTVNVVDNTPPTVSCPSNITVVADAGVCTATVDYNLSGNDNCGGTVMTTIVPSGTAFPIGTTTVSVTATDAAGNSNNCSFTVTVTDPNPVVAITGPATGTVFPVNTPVNLTGTYTDAGGGTHTALWTFDMTTQAGTVTEPSGSTPGTVSATHLFTTAGVYMVSLTLNDSCGGIGSSQTIEGLPAMVVIYDPEKGFVTGGGWIDSPAGAFVGDATLVGKANFGFVSKYQKGAAIPTGQTEFQFKVANFNFHSTSYDWLVVAGAKAQYKGVGNINGSGNYGFMLTAIDGRINGGGGVDKFRIKIWDKNNGDAIVYDNHIGAPDNSDPTTALGGGSVVIQK